MANNINITVTEILGTDSMNNSRVTINNNFKTLANAINLIGSVVNENEIGTQNTGLTGRSLRIGDSIVVDSNGITVDGYTLTAAHIEKIINLFENGVLNIVSGNQQNSFRVDVNNAGIDFQINGEVGSTVCKINGNDILTDSGTGE